MSRVSPLHAIHERGGAVFEAAGQWSLPAHYGDEAAEYRAARDRAAVIDLCDRTKIELSGADRVTFLHNLCTNDVKGLSAGNGCEAFLTSAQAKILGHLYVFASPESLVVDTVAGQAEGLIAHLDHYHIRESVTLKDRTSEWAELLVCGPLAAGLLEKLGAVVPDKALAHAESTLQGPKCFVRRHDLAGEPSYAIVAAREDAESIWNALVGGGAVPAGRRAFETLRVEAGVPFYGIDVTDAHLPQEVGRDQQAISFTKGCYIGQETVARIDSYGHVNRKLVGLKIVGEDVPDRGAKVVRDEKEVGQTTSAVFSPQLQSPIALAYVRRGSEAVGTALQVESADTRQKAEVVALPFRLTT